MVESRGQRMKLETSIEVKEADRMMTSFATRSSWVTSLVYSPTIVRTGVVK